MKLTAIIARMIFTERFHLMRCPPIEVRMAAKCMEVRTSAMDMLAQMMVTATVAVVDTLFPSRSEGACLWLMTACVLASSNLHLHHLYQPACHQSSPQLKTCTRFRTALTTSGRYLTPTASQHMKISSPVGLMARTSYAMVSFAKMAQTANPGAAPPFKR